MSGRRSHRVISMPLLSAAPIARPDCIPRSRPRGVRATGLRFERQLAKKIDRDGKLRATPGQWFEYVDQNGHGYCQTDLIVWWHDAPVVLECKLSNCDQARAQLSELYLPVVTKAYGTAAYGIVVTKSLSRESNLALVKSELGLALVASRTKIPTFHWLGGTAPL